MKRILVGYKVRNKYGISIDGRLSLANSGFDISEDRTKFGIIVDVNENDESIDEMLEAMINAMAKNESDFEGFVSRCTKGEWEI